MNGELWRVFDRVSFEDGIAAERVSGEQVLLRLDYPAYFDLLDVPLPDGHAAILDALRRDRLIEPCERAVSTSRTSVPSCSRRTSATSGGCNAKP